MKEDGGEMDTQKNLIMLGIVFFLLCISLSGCNQLNNSLDTERNRFIGTWMTTSEVPSINWTMTLSPDGTCTGAVPGNTWALNDGKLIFMAISQDNAVVGTYAYVFSTNRTLTLTDITTNGSKIYLKQ